MSAPTKLSRLLSVTRRLTAFGERQVQRLGEAGGWPAVYPSILGVALSASLLELFPKLGRQLHSKWGAVLVVILGVVLLHLLLLAAATWSWRKKRGFDLLPVSQNIWRKGAFLAGLPLMLELREPLERKNQYLVLSYAVIIGLLFGYTAYHAGLPRRVQGWWQRQRERRWPKISAWIALGGLLLAYTVTLSSIAIDNHMSFNTGRIDLGWYVNIVRRSSVGDLLGCSLCSTGTHINAHFDPVLALISPLMWIYPEAETLLVFQSLWLGSAVVPLFMLARHYQISAPSALALCASYCLYPALHGINLFDFHSLAMVVPLVVWLWLCFELGWVKRYFVVLALLLLVREDAALLTVFLGMAFLVSGNPRALRLGGSTIVIAGCYFLFVKGVVMPNSDLLNKKKGARGYAYYYEELLPKGKDSAAGLLTVLMSEPARLLRLALQEDKVSYLAKLAVPVLGLPFVARWGKVAIGYGLAFALLATRPFVHSLHFHYSANVVSVVFVLTVLGVAALPTRINARLGAARLQRAAAIAILACSVVCTIKFGGIVPNGTFKAGFGNLKRKPSQSHLDRDRWIKEQCAKLPKDAAVTGASNMIPHMGRCRNVVNYMKLHEADYVLWPADGVEEGKGWAREIKSEVKAGTLRQIDSGQGMVVLERVGEPKTKRKKKKR